MWHSSTYRLETTLNYGLERVWAFATMRGSNDVAIGYDEGSVVIKVCSAVFHPVHGVTCSSPYLSHPSHLPLPSHLSHPSHLPLPDGPRGACYEHGQQWQDHVVQAQ